MFLKTMTFAVAFGMAASVASAASVSLFSGSANELTNVTDAATDAVEGATDAAEGAVEGATDAAVDAKPELTGLSETVSVSAGVAGTIEDLRLRAQIADPEATLQGRLSGLGRELAWELDIEAPSINGLPDWYVKSTLAKFKDGVRGAHPDDMEGKLMAPMAQILATDDMIKNVAEYIKSFSKKK